MKPIFVMTILALLIETASCSVMPDMHQLQKSHADDIIKEKNNILMIKAPSCDRLNISAMLSRIIIGQAINDVSNIITGQTFNGAKIYLRNMKTGNISRREFQCNLISSCGIYPYGKHNNGDGAIVNLGVVKSGATVSVIDGSTRLVSRNKN